MDRLPLVRLLGVLVLVLWASVVVGDPRPMVRFGSTIQEAAGVYQYASVLSGDGNWAARGLRRLRDAADRPPGGVASPGARDFSSAFRGDAFDEDEEAGSRGGGTDDALGLSADTAGPETFEVGLALPSDVDDPDEYPDLLSEVPEGALEFADVVVAYANGTRVLILDFNKVVQDKLDLDWEQILHSLSIMDGEEFAIERKPHGRLKTAAKKALDDTVSSVQRMRRSALRISIGFGIGLLLWWVVRRF